MTFRIGIDGYNLAMPHGTGVATYGFTLAHRIRALGHRVDGVFGIDAGQDRATRELAFFDQFGRERSLTRWQRRRRAVTMARRALGAARLVEVPLTADVAKDSHTDRLPEFDALWTSADLFDVARYHFAMFGRFLTVRMPDPPAIMHWTYPVPVRLAGARNIYTLHDLVPLRLPYTTADYKKEYFRLINACVRGADHICTVSEASKADIVGRFPDVAGKITNTYQSASLPSDMLASRPDDDARMIAGIFGLQPQEYFLYFGALDPKKNLGRVIEAYLSTCSATPLVIVGGRNWGTEAQFKGEGINVYGHQVDNRIRRLDHLPKLLLFRLIRGARAVLFPSLYEGFGLPALEAMMIGTPVISSNISALPEVVGDAGLLVDPYSVADLAGAILTLDSDPALRAELSARGLRQSSRFNKEAYAERLEQMYQAVAAPPGAR